MRRLLPLILCLSLVPLVLAACGEDEQEFSVSAAEAAKATRAEQSAKATLVTEVSGGGIPLPVTVKADGVTSVTGDPKMDLTFDLGPLLSLAGAPAAGDGKLRVVLADGDLFVDPPAVDQLELPGGAQWVTADLSTLVKSLGVDASAFSELLRLTPDQQLTGLEASGDLKEVGTETVDGVKTKHYKGTLKLSDYVAALPAEKRDAARKALDELEKLAGPEAGKQLDEPQPFDVWLGEDKLMRRLVQTTDVPAQNGVPAMKVKQTMELGDYGTKLDVTAPDKSDTYDATDDLKGLLKSAAAQQGLTTG
jgi:hypothetical protein